MFGWIAKSALPDPDEIEWLFEVYSWLLAHTGGFDAFKNTALVLPDEEFFPPAKEPIEDEEELAQHLFHLTKANAGLRDWPCRLVPHDNAPAATDILKYAPSTHQDRGPAGTFSYRGGRRPEITYAVGSVKNPISFIATLAHELGHYLMSTIPVNPPGGAEAEEPATDVCSVFLGFGIFASNSAFRFHQFHESGMQGWSSHRLGYLSEQTFAYALAIFVELQQLAPGDVRRHLSSNPSSFLKHALRHLHRHRASDIDALRKTRVLTS